MFALLLIVIVALGGLLGLVVFGGISLDTLPGLPIAAVVIAVLIILYLATLPAGRDDRGFGRLPILLGVLAILGLAAAALRADPSALLANLFASAKTDDETASFTRSAPASIRIRRRPEGGFVANAEVNGEAMAMLIDSGAATVVLRQSDAERAGVDVRALTFDTPLKTANGTGYLAAVRLKSVRIGPLAIDDVEALVAKPGTLNENLLGQSFLRRLTSYEVAGDFATLRQ